MTDFSDRPFAMGSVLGLRAFRVTEEAMLRPVSSAPYVWVSGENQAECFAGALNHNGPRLIDEKYHKLIGLRCTCGFYAYFGGVNNYDNHNNTVAGIIEGYGRCVIGSKGFRCERARILCFVRPTLGNVERITGTIEEVSKNYPDVPIYATEEALRIYSVAHPTTKSVMADGGE